MPRPIPPDPTDSYFEAFTVDSPTNGEIIDGLGPAVPINVTSNAPFTDDTLAILAFITGFSRPFLTDVIGKVSGKVV